MGLYEVETSDAATIRRVLDGDVDAYAILVARYRDRYARFAVHMLGNREDAEEALQDAFVRAYRSLHRCEEPERFGRWFLSILANRCRTAGAKRGRYERVVVTDEHAMLGASQGHPAERTAWREEIRLALAQLPSDQREAFLLKHVEELSYEEMSLLTGIGVSALKMRVNRACGKLRDLLREACSA
ncbi:MAG: RNA polymerase sigma factor [Gemmatimonadaceae bacterium]